MLGVKIFTLVSHSLIMSPDIVMASVLNGLIVRKLPQIHTHVGTVLQRRLVKGVWKRFLVVGVVTQSIQ